MADSPEGFLAGLGIRVEMVVAGLAGAMIYIVRHRGLSPREAIAGFLSGFLFAIFLGPAIGDYFTLTLRQLCGVVFLLGFLGMALLTGLLNLAQRFSVDPLGVITFLRNRGGSP